MEKALSSYVSDLSFEDLPQDVVEYCKLLIMDSLGVTLPGSQALGCPEVVELIKSWRGALGSRILIHGTRVAPPLAALVNGMMMHALDFDDTFDASALHTFVNVLPAALATADFLGNRDGKELITALVAGVDIICRISVAIKRPLSWIRTSTCGSFGAAATAGKILGLSEDEMLNALGIVYSQTAGNAQGLVEGKLVKRMQPGFASQAGVASAFLARAGISGSHSFLEGKYGFFNLYEGGEYDPEKVVEGLGDDFFISKLSLKPYPCCRMIHSSIDAALELRKTTPIDHGEVEEVVVTVSRMVKEMVGKPFILRSNPQVDAQFSIPYTVSVALIRGDVFLKDFEAPAVFDENTRALAEKVRVISDPALPEKDIEHARLKIRTKQGKEYCSAVEAPLGNPSNPLSMRQCMEKFLKCLSHSALPFEKGQSEELLSMIRNLEKLGDVRELVRFMVLQGKQLYN